MQLKYQKDFIIFNWNLKFQYFHLLHMQTVSGIAVNCYVIGLYILE